LCASWPRDAEAMAVNPDAAVFAHESCKYCFFFSSPSQLFTQTLTLIFMTLFCILFVYQRDRTLMAILHQSHTDTAHQIEGRRLFHQSESLYI